MDFSENKHTKLVHVLFKNVHVCASNTALYLETSLLEKLAKFGSYFLEP